MLGQLIQQKSTKAGFTGLSHDRVGPGDYDINHAKNIISKSTTGVVQWKKPSTQNPTEASDEKKKLPPGPGEYNVEAALMGKTKPMTSMFQSKVARTNTAMATQSMRNKSFSTFHKKPPS